MSIFGSVVEKQNTLFGLIARAYDNALKLGPEKLNQFALDTRLQSLEVNWEKFQVNHDKLLTAITEEMRKQPYFSDDLYALYEEAYYESKAGILQKREPFLAKPVVNDPPQQVSSFSLSSSLPKIDLSKFSGDYHDWPSFRDLFFSIVGSNRNIPDVQKLHFLKTQTTGDAVRYIANIKVTAENYSRAWQTLISRYENRRVLVATYLDRIFDIKPLTQKSNSELKALLATVKESLDALHTLGAPTDQWDILIVHIVTRRLDAHTLEAWELELGNTTELATFKTLELFLEGRIRALETIQFRTAKPATATSRSSAKPKPTVRAHAATTNAVKCTFCNAAHYVASCPDFASKSLSERQDFVNRKHLCFNCLGSHRLSECRTLKRCRHCKGQHHTLLHRQVTSPST